MADYKKPDYWQLKARENGYPARSVYKLSEMDTKFNLLRSAASGGGAFRILDLGAAPGSWSLYTLRKMPCKKSIPGGFLCAVDLTPLSRQYDQGLFAGDNFRFIQGDFTDPAVRDEILSYGPYRLIISDAAPATMGNHSIDTIRSLELAWAVYNYAVIALETGGNLAMKVFQGGDTEVLLKDMKRRFKTARGFKPRASRKESYELYYLGLEHGISAP